VLPWLTYTGTKLETVDTDKASLQLTRTSSTRRAHWTWLTRVDRFEASSSQDNLPLVGFSNSQLVQRHRGSAAALPPGATSL
jgi:hypothetical protein